MYYYFCDFWENIIWFDALIYIVALTALFFTLYIEYYDLYCRGVGKTSRYGNGAAYEAGRPYKNDNIHTLLSKIRISARYDEASVYWRRVIIFSVLLMFTILPILLGRMPNGLELLVSFITIYLFTYLFLVYYQEVVSKPATAQVNEATALLSK